MMYDSNLYVSYFIGGEWDGVKKRTDGQLFIKVRKSQTIKEKHKILGGLTVGIETEEEIYELAASFSDGVKIYRLKAVNDEIINL